MRDELITKRYDETRQRYEAATKRAARADELSDRATWERICRGETEPGADEQAATAELVAAQLELVWAKVGLRQAMSDFLNPDRLPIHDERGRQRTGSAPVFPRFDLFHRTKRATQTSVESRKE